MSTKIHNGYRLAEGTSPFEFARRVRAALDPVRDRTDAALLATLFATAVDKHWVNGQPIAPVLAFTALSDWEDRQQSMPKDSRAHDPNGFEMCLGEDPATGRILVRAYTQHPDLAEAFAAMPEIEPYSYWNNADAPDTLTEEDWADREAAWARVMPHYAAPAEHMLSFVLRTPANPRTLMLCSMNGGAEDPVLTRFPDRAARAHRRADGVRPAPHRGRRRRRRGRPPHPRPARCAGHRGRGPGTPPARTDPGPAAGRHRRHDPGAGVAGRVEAACAAVHAAEQGAPTQ